MHLNCMFLLTYRNAISVLSFIKAVVNCLPYYLTLQLSSSLLRKCLSRPSEVKGEAAS